MVNVGGAFRVRANGGGDLSNGKERINQLPKSPANSFVVKRGRRVASQDRETSNENLRQAS
jgi:hypothetical protein